VVLSYGESATGGEWVGAARGHETRERLLRAAETVFAERGIAGAQLREIGRAAGQRNNAAVHYYFGDKDRLIRAVLERGAAESEALRARRVRRLARSMSAPAVTDIVDAALRPLSVHLRRGDRYLMFLSQLTRERGLDGSLGAPGIAPSLCVLRYRLGETLSEAARIPLDGRWSLALASGIHALALHQSVAERERSAGSEHGIRTAHVDGLVCFLAAGIEGRGRQEPPAMPRAPARAGDQST